MFQWDGIAQIISNVGSDYSNRKFPEVWTVRDGALFWPLAPRIWRFTSGQEVISYLGCEIHQ